MKRRRQPLLGTLVLAIQVLTAGLLPLDAAAQQPDNTATFCDTNTLAPQPPIVYAQRAIPPIPHGQGAASPTVREQDATPSPLRRIPMLGQVPQRVVSLDPAATHTLCAMGKANCLVGQAFVPDTLTTSAKDVPFVGTPDTPQVQAILGLLPELVIAHPSRYFALAPVLQQGIPVLWLDYARLADVEANIRCLGVLMQTQDKAEHLISTNNALRDIALHKTAALHKNAAREGHARPRVLHVLGVHGTQCLVPAAGDIANERLHLLGAITPEVYSGGNNGDNDRNSEARRSKGDGGGHGGGDNRSNKENNNGSYNGSYNRGNAIRFTADEVRNFNPQYICIDATQEAALKNLLRTAPWAGIHAEVITFPRYYMRNPGIDYGMFTLWLATTLHPQGMSRTDVQLKEDAVLAQTPLTLPFACVSHARISQERVFDIPAKTLQVHFARGQRVLSTLHGLQSDVRAVGNHYTPPPGWPLTHHLGMDAVNARLHRLLASGRKTLLLHTGADVEKFAFAEARSHDLHVGVLVTAGVTTNALRAGTDSGAFVEHGTINMIALTNKKLSDAAMMQALITITEAKTAVLQELDIRSTPSGRAATGTGTDAIMIVAGEGDSITMSGGHTKMGELLAEATAKAVRTAIAKQNALTPQRSLRHRLAERGIDLMPVTLALSAPEHAARIAQTVAARLNEPYYAGFVAAALALADSNAYNTLSDMQAFGAWCLETASRATGKKMYVLPHLYGDPLPPPLAMALNALAAGSE